MEGTTGTIEVLLKQTAVMPSISCPKELIDSEGMRLLKVGVLPSKAKKETKITFKSEPDNIRFTLVGDLLGEGQAGGHVEMKPKLIQVPAGRGGFMVSIISTLDTPKNYVHT